ncbi:MAG TPA: FtsK/SpoIIIE domain-containing protein [Jiangellaceae bacterium]|nr:FtsK/SpoIIIE domain-containing protein [Jiangellaceae bacterium]
MRITLTVTDPQRGTVVDILLDAEEGTPLGEVGDALRRALGRETSGHQQSVSGVDADPAVVSLADHRQNRGAEGLLETETTTLTDPSTELYVGGSRLDPATALVDSALREGCIVSLGDPSGGVLPEPEGVVEIRVVNGAGAGVVHRLRPGAAEIGTAASCLVRVEDPAVPAVAAVAQVGVDGSVRVAPGSADVEPLLDREPLAAAAPWHDGAQLIVGGVVLEAATPQPPNAALEPSEDGTGWDYNRPPRLLPPERQTKYKLPHPPQEAGKRAIPIIAAIAPLMMAIVMVTIMGNVRYLAFGLMTPMILIGNFFYDKKNKKTTYREQVAEYERTKGEVEGDANEALLLERSDRRWDVPDPASCLLISTGPRARLWERRRDDPDHLLLRVGLADQPSEVVLEDPEALEHRRLVTWDALDVPATIPLAERGVIGISGADDFPQRTSAWMLSQLAVLQSPRDVQFVILTQPSAEAYWSWARWLPHIRPTNGQDTVGLFGADTESLARRIAEVGAIIEARTSALRESRSATFEDPDIVVVLDGARRLRSMPGVIQILAAGPKVGVRTICLDTDERLLPEECNAVAVQTSSGLEVRQQRVQQTEQVRPDITPWKWFQRVARALSAIRDVTDTGTDSSLPSGCRLLDVMDLEPPTTGGIAGRWATGGRTTEAVIGASIDGPFALDLRKDGPHGLIAGTTGSGKSELLQTIVASLAVENRPDAMTFVLVDYKGGAAFKDCVELPHTVGMVTDLDTHLVERALISLGAELQRREHILSAAGAKDIEDYTDMMAKNDLAPVPRLLIVIDEFASMARELPDFVTGLVNIAQRGRSLGIHLILATQRPSGVVSPEIRANTNLRIALRVTDASESKDVLDSPEAGAIAKSTPGRGYVRLGASSLVPFQAGRVGGRRPGEQRQDPDPPFVAPIDWGELGRPAPTKPKKKEAETDAEITDLKVLVEAIQDANAQIGVPAQHSPWLPALPEALLLDELEEQFPDLSETAPESPSLRPVPFAVEDVPSEQARRASVIDLDTFSHLYVVGSPRSGRSQILRTIAGGLARQVGVPDLHVFGLDCGNGALLPLTHLPHCGAIAQRTQTERAKRLVERLRSETTSRQELLATGGFADITEQRAGVAPEERLPHLLLLIDRWEGFTGSLGEVDNGSLTEAVQTMLREGASVGVHIIITGDRTLVSSKMSALCERKLVFRLSERSDYSLAGLVARKMPETMAPGRGFWSDGAVEAQVAMLSADESGKAQAAVLESIGAEAAEAAREVPRSQRPFRVDVLPAKLGFDDAWLMREEAQDRALWGMIGVGGDELVAMGPDLNGSPGGFIVGGPPKSGRSTLLLTMTLSFLRQGGEVVILAPRPSPLRELDGREGVRAVLTSDSFGTDDVSGLFKGTEPIALVIDDGELLKDVEAKDWLKKYVRAVNDEADLGLVLGGNSADLGSGFSGWQVDAKKNRAGALLSPQAMTEGDLIGVRLPRSAYGGAVQPGRALVNFGSGELHTVQVPITTLD